MNFYNSRRNFLKQLGNTSVGLSLYPLLPQDLLRDKNSLMKAPLDRSRIPEPVLDVEPQLTEIYWLAWEQAWNHVLEKKGALQTPYMDEAFSDSTIWI